MPWSAQVIPGSGWFSITSGVSGTNSGTIISNYSANTTTSSRTATIRITASGAAGSPMDVTVTQAPASTGGALAASYPGSGIFIYNAESATWTQVSPSNPENMSASGTSVYADFGVSGLWEWNGTGWAQLTSGNPENMSASGALLYADLGASGLWQWNGSNWFQTTVANPFIMTTSN